LNKGVANAMARNGSTFQYEAYIRASADDVWRAITDGKQTAQYFYGSPVKSSLKTGADFLYLTPDGKERMAEATIFAIEPKHRLILEKYRLLYSPPVAEDKPSRETWEVTPMGEITKVVVVHDEMSPNGATYKDVSAGLPLIVSSMKSLLETGNALPMQADGAS
jgi:uncharacterized protein YndB with AHSA1/START domain